MGQSRSEKRAKRQIARTLVLCVGPNNETWCDSLERVSALMKQGEAHRLSDKAFAGDLALEVAAAGRMVVYVPSGVPSGLRGESCSIDPEYMWRLATDDRMRPDFAAIHDIQVGVMRGCIVECAA